MFTTHWLLTVAACILAFCWSFSCPRGRFWLSLGLSLLALMSSYWGLTCIHITWTQTDNGRFHRVFDTGWFFTASIVLAALAFAFVLWKRWRLWCVTMRSEDGPKSMPRVY
jgi:hypothetical protein